MKTRALGIALALSFALSFILAAPADAGLRAGGSRGAMNGSIVIPAEWSGVWSFADSVYECDGPLQSYDTGIDTLCAGQPIDVDYDTEFSLECTESVTGTTVEQHCTGTGPIEGTECSMTFTLDSIGTRTGDSYVITSTIRMEVSGVAKECGFFPPSCTRIVSRGTRIAPQPDAYCATPVAPTTWGRMKSQYR